MRKVLAALLTCGAVVVAAPASYASCPGTSVPLQHQASYFQCKDTSPVAAFAWQLNAPTTVTSGTEKIECEAQDGVTCFGNSGVKGDGQVTIESDWGNAGIVGCPDVGGVKQRIMISVQCNDGTGVLVSLGGAQVDAFGAYVVESAHNTNFDPLVADNNAGRPAVVNFADAGGGNVTLQLRFPTNITVHSDCDPGSFGLANGVCTDSFNPTKGVGRIFTSQQLCKDATGADIPPAVDRNSTVPGRQWTLSAVTPDATGNAVITAPKPTTANTCLYVGATTVINGNESSSLTGFVAVGGPGAPSPVATSVRAEQAGGNVRIRWSTDSEVGLQGFNILAEGKKGSVQVNTELIAAKGNGGRASYEQLVGRNKFQGNQTVIIESVLTDGTKLRSAPAKF